MFVDFNRVFSGKPQTELKIPDALVKHLSSNLPKGVKYKSTRNGNVEIVSEGESVNIGGLIFVPTEEHLKILGKKYSLDDILNYSYNAQKRIPLKLKKEGYILLNGEEFPIDRIKYNPYCPVSVVAGEFFMYPPPFPKEFPLIIGNEKYTKQMLFKRIPNESVNIAAFESEKEQPLKVRYYVDEKKHTISFNISFNLSYVKTIRDIVEATSIYNAFVDGKGIFCGQPLVTDIDSSKFKKYDTDSIAFWEKVLVIEKELGVSFEPPQDDVDFYTIRTIEMLYQNLINNTPIKEISKIESLDGEWNMHEDNPVNDSVGKPLYFEFQATSHISLFGVEKDLPSVIGIFDSVISNYSVKGKKYKLLLENLSDERHMYTSTIRFASEEKMLNYLDGNHDDRITALHNAKTVEEHLKEQESFI